MSTTKPDRLCAAQAEALWRLWRERGDATSRDRLVIAYSPLVDYLVSQKLRQLPAHCDFDDLASSGLVALIEAVERFDPARGASFEHFAWTRVTGGIVDELRRQDWASRSVRRAGRAIERARDAFAIRTGAQPTHEQLAAELRITPLELRSWLDDLQRAELVSLSSTTGHHDEPALLELGDTLEDPTGEYEPEAALVRGDRSAAVRRAVARLSERERTVLSLVHVHELPGLEIGLRLGVTESRVSQILAEVRRKLRRDLARYDEPLAA